MEKNLTSGSVLKNIIYFSLPYLLSYFLQTLYGMADLFIIGQFEGVASTTAVSIGSQVMHMITVMIVGLAMGSTVTIAQAIGARDKKSASRTIGNTVALFMAVAVGLMVILLLLVHPIVSVMSTPLEAVTGTVAYLTVCFIGIPCITAYNIISSIFRGIGDSKSPMYFIAIACVVNIGLDYLWFKKDPWQVENANRLQRFYCEEQREHWDGVFLIDGTRLEEKALHPVAIVAVNAQASLAADGPHIKECVDRFWNTPLRTGDRRYYDNFLYLFAMLALSGNYRIYK